MQSIFKRRWTLGGMMILIAVIAMPLALYVRHAREIATQQALMDKLVKEIDKRLSQDLHAQMNRQSGPLQYFEYDESQVGVTPK